MRWFTACLVSVVLASTVVALADDPPTEPAPPVTVVPAPAPYAPPTLPAPAPAVAPSATPRQYAPSPYVPAPTPYAPSPVPQQPQAVYPVPHRSRISDGSSVITPAPAYAYPVPQIATAPVYAPISAVDPSDAAAKLEALLKKRFPTAKIEIVAAPGGLILDGTVADPNHISRIVQIAEFFHPRVLNNLTVAGVQVLVKVKVVEINATRLQDGCNCERAQLAGYGSAADILGKIGVAGVADLPPGTARGSTLSPTVIGADSEVFGLIEALRKADLANILAEPNVVSCSGRPTSFVSGGEFPVSVMRGEKVATEWRKFGTEVEIVNSIIGEKRLRVDAKVRISAIDPTRSVKAFRVVDSAITVPALQVFEVNTAFEANSGQTFVLVGLAQLRDDKDNKNKRDKAAEDVIIRLVLITPLLVEAQETTVVAGPAGEASSTSATRHPDAARQ